jgi:hypothetical protein
VKVRIPLPAAASPGRADGPEPLAGVPTLAVTITGPEEETPELWADLVETVLQGLVEERRRRSGRKSA